MRKENGFTIIELIVVITILGIVAGSLIIGISQFLIMNVDYGMKSLQSALESARYANMSMVDGKVDCIIEKRPNCYYILVDTSDESTKDEYKIYSTRYDLEIKQGIIEYAIDEDNSANIYFNREGRLDKIKVGGIEIPIIEDFVCFIEPSSEKGVKTIRMTGRSTILE